MAEPCSCTDEKTCDACFERELALTRRDIATAPRRAIVRGVPAEMSAAEFYRACKDNPDALPDDYYD